MIMRSGISRIQRQKDQRKKTVEHANQEQAVDCIIFRLLFHHPYNKDANQNAI